MSMRNISGGTHDFDDTNDFAGDKLEDKLGKSAKWAFSRKIINENIGINNRIHERTGFGGV